MKNSLLAVGCVSILLSGCAHIQLNDQKRTFEPSSGNAILSGIKVDNFDNSAPGFQILASQVLNRQMPTKVPLEIRGSMVRYATNDHQLPTPLARSALMKKILLSREQTNTIRVSSGELKAFSEALFTSLQDIHNDTERQKEISKSRTNNELRFDSVLFAYYYDYFAGKFVTRQGITLGKPTIKAELKDWQISGEIDNDTLTGLFTVFLEATFDFISPTPVYADLNKIQSWEEKHIVTSQVDTDTGNKLYQLMYIEHMSNDYFTDSGKQPTCAKHKVVPIKQVVENANGITKAEFKYIAFAVSLSSKQSKHLAGLLVRAIGKVNAGLSVIEGGFSIGDNDTFTKLAETLVEVSTRRSLEYALSEFFEKYELDRNEKNPNPVTTLLDNINAISK